jgi:hypothetical protein
VLEHDAVFGSERDARLVPALVGFCSALVGSQAGGLLCHLRLALLSPTAASMQQKN